MDFPQNNHKRLEVDKKIHWEKLLKFGKISNQLVSLHGLFSQYTAVSPERALLFLSLINSTKQKAF